MNRRLVSVVTPTWERHELVLGAHENVLDQAYRPLEHVIVSDGPDPGLRSLIGVLDASDVTVRFVELGRNWSTFLPDAFCAAPLTVAMFVASGSYQLWLADDERMTPDHISALVALLERDDADFAYSKAELYHREAPDRRWVIGTDPPERGQITNVLYRAEVLKHGLYVFGDDRTSDWATISRWIAAGARGVMLDRVTLTHRVDR